MADTAKIYRISSDLFLDYSRISFRVTMTYSIAVKSVIVIVLNVHGHINQNFSVSNDYIS